MRRHTPILIVSILLGLLLASTAAAEYFTITMTNGTSFESRYRPADVEWDPDIQLIHTDRGNPIALRKDEIADVISHAEATGFGYQVDTTTIFVGWMPNDDLEEEGEDGEGGGEGGLNLEEMFPEAQQNFGLQQFIDIPGDATEQLNSQPADVGFN